MRDLAQQQVHELQDVKRNMQLELESVYREWELLKSQQAELAWRRQGGDQQQQQPASERELEMQATIEQLAEERAQILQNWSDETAGLVAIYREDKEKWEAALAQQQEENRNLAGLLERERKY